MLLIAIPILILSVVIYGIEKYHGARKHYFSSVIIVLLVYFMVAGNYKNADSTVYETTYNINTSQWTFRIFSQWAYYLLINICNSLHLSFIQYRFVTYAIGFIAMIAAIHKVETNLYSVLLLYSLFPMIIDATQMKNFIAMCFITFAITFLARGEKKDKFMFLLMIIIGAGFQITALAFIPLVVLCDNNYNKRMKLLAILPIVLFALLFSNRAMSALLSNYLLDFFTDSRFARASMYLNSRVNYGFLIYLIATFVFIYIVYKLRRIIISSNYSTSKEKKYSNVVFYSSIFSLTFVPLYFIKLDFARLLRILIPTYHMLFSMAFSVLDRPYQDKQRSLVVRINSTKTVLAFLYLIMLAYMFYWEIYSFKDSVMLPFFDYNIVTR